MSATRRAFACLVLAVMAIGCNVGATPSLTPTVAPSPSEVPGPSPTPEPTVDASLPTAFATDPDGARVEGTIGSYTFDGRGGDAPWLAFDGLNVLELGHDASIDVAFGDGAELAHWRAQAGPLDMQAGDAVETIASGGSGGAAVIGPIPDGRYVLAVALTRADGRGDGIFYWAVVAGQ